MSTTAKPGWATSEFSAMIGTWLGVQAMPEHLIWPTVAVTCTYLVSRSMTKFGTGGQAICQPEPEPAPTGGGMSTAARAAAPVLLCLAVLWAPGCQALQDVLGQELPQQPVTVQTEGGGLATGQPVPQPGAPITGEIPGVGSVVVQPAPRPTGTVGAAAGELLGGIAGAVTGQPALGAVVGVILAGLMQVAQ